MNSIHIIRARLGVTQAAMAAGIGVTQGNVSNYERGQRMPPHVAGRLISYAKSLNHTITYDDIYGLAKPRRRAKTKAEAAPESQPQ
jgi:putative transcriptional regulator